MTTWNPRANELFLKALELRSAEERQAYLDKACGGDAPLRAEVESLLEASARAKADRADAVHAIRYDGQHSCVHEPFRFYIVVYITGY